jgi:hypothetical protein
VATRRPARPPLDGLTSHAGSDGYARRVRSTAPVFRNVTRSARYQINVQPQHLLPGDSAALRRPRDLTPY